jgi:hypothetical protein
VGPELRYDEIGSWNPNSVARRWDGGTKICVSKAHEMDLLLSMEIALDFTWRFKTLVSFAACYHMIQSTPTTQTNAPTINTNPRPTSRPISILYQTPSCKIAPTVPAINATNQTQTPTLAVAFK